MRRYVATSVNPLRHPLESIKADGVGGETAPPGGHTFFGNGTDGSMRRRRRREKPEVQLHAKKGRVDCRIPSGVM
jgi:hypothetical protein